MLEISKGTTERADGQRPDVTLTKRFFSQLLKRILKVSQEQWWSTVSLVPLECLCFVTFQALKMIFFAVQQADSAFPAVFLALASCSMLPISEGQLAKRWLQRHELGRQSWESEKCSSSSSLATRLR